MCPASLQALLSPASQPRAHDSTSPSRQPCASFSSSAEPLAGVCASDVAAPQPASDEIDTNRVMATAVFIAFSTPLAPLGLRGLVAAGGAAVQCPADQECRRFERGQALRRHVSIPHDTIQSLLRIRGGI